MRSAGFNSCPAVTYLISLTNYCWVGTKACTPCSYLRLRVGDHYTVNDGAAEETASWQYITLCTLPSFPVSICLSGDFIDGGGIEGWPPHLHPFPWSAVVSISVHVHLINSFEEKSTFSTEEKQYYLKVSKKNTHFLLKTFDPYLLLLINMSLLSFPPS